MTSDVPAPITPYATKSVRWWRGWVGPMLVVVGLVPGMLFLWFRPVRIALSDGRVLVIDKLSIGSPHIAYERFTLKNFWTTVSRWPMSWPNVNYHGEEGTVGVFYHCEHASQDSTESLYLVDRDGWWWASTQGGQVSGDRRLEVFPPIELASPTQLEVWNNDLRIGGRSVSITPPRLPEPAHREPAPFPIRWEQGETLVIVQGVDVTTRDNVRPSEADVHLQIETFRAGRPVDMKISDLIVTNNRSRGGRCQVDEEGWFRTRLSPHAPYWTIHFFVSWPSELTGEEFALVDLVIRPQVVGSTPTARLKPAREKPSLTSEKQTLGRTLREQEPSAVDPK